MPHAYVITRPELSRLVETARHRGGSKDRSWSPSRRVLDVLSDLDADVLGLCGEYAASRLLGVDLDWTCGAGGDHGRDLVLSDGRTVAVKFNHRWRGQLMVESRPGDTPERLMDLSADLIISTHGTCSPDHECRCGSISRCERAVPVMFSGWLRREEFLSRMERRDYGLGGRYVVRPRDLHGIMDLARVR